MTKVDKKINDIFDKLMLYANYPDYQLERRLDVFFLVYLKEILAINNIDMQDTFIFPEFPLLKKYENNFENSNNSLACKSADYVIFSNKKMYIIELKTDMKSIKKNQLNFYNKVASKAIRNINY